jgi:signal transduction histidine kinase
VDNNVHEVELVRQALLRDPGFHYEFIEVQSAAQALSLLARDHDLDLMILDWCLSDGSGARLVRQLVSQPAQPMLPIMVLTSREATETNEPLLEKCVHDVFSKDVLSSDVLPVLVSHSIERFQLTRELLDQREVVAEARQQAEEASRTKSAFLTGMSHELRTPLTAILGLADLLLEDPTIDDSHHILEMIRSNGQHLTALLADLLDLAKIEVGKSSIDYVHCDISRITRELCEFMRPRAREEGLVLQLDIDPSCPAVVYTDPVRYRQIVMNLVGNALRFTGEGGVHLTIREKPSSPETYQLVVRDTGPGISCKACKSLFEPFAQGDSAAAGVGLGLSISRSLARALGGELSYQPDTHVAASAGATFVLELPVGTRGTASSSCQSVQPTPVAVNEAVPAPGSCSLRYALRGPG